MSHHEFLCHDCYKGFLKTLTRHDYEEGEVTCPHCGSDRVELRVTLPDAATKKSAQGGTTNTRLYIACPDRRQLRHRAFLPGRTCSGTCQVINRT
jgi:DNA-directed RNA polymerase subunit RPC12/RpoP